MALSDGHNDEGEAGGPVLPVRELAPCPTESAMNIKGAFVQAPAVGCVDS